ncbi:unnamed protein product [Phytophthora lilii]|uniref:Unnamed protein product n=1 Tax=Phytophthora lilii TaxID=2077276 RepID=A0A9W6XFM0_9STRA|nr:unnamed protein product [Phytophthora lilii]
MIPSRLEFESRYAPPDWDVGTERIRHYASGPVEAEVLLAANVLCIDENHYPKHRGKSKRAIGKIEKYYFNAEYYVVQDDNIHGSNVDGPRVRLVDMCSRFACLHLVDSVDLNAMLQGLPARKPPGRPSKKTIRLDRDGLRRSQYSVDALIKRLFDKSASVINWSILGTWTSTDDEGVEIERDYVGLVKAPFLYVTEMWSFLRLKP